MSIISIVIISIGLAMDAFAVSLSSGMVLKKLRASNALKIALFFGGFQGGMTLLGWAMGFKFKVYIESIDHWIAFIMLSIIGGKMIYEAFNEDSEEEKDPLKTSVLVLLAIATSIDALVVGVSFAFLEVDILSASLIIGGITLVLCYIGVYVGKRFGDLLNKNAEIFGGVLLIIMGIKILLQHTGIL